MFSSPSNAAAAPSAKLSFERKTNCEATVPTTTEGSCAFMPTPNMYACVCCGNPLRPSLLPSDGCCSKRCSWWLSARCPQCGRPRGNGWTYCSSHCASNALQANWCLTCGVHQVILGMSFCSESCASMGSNLLVQVRPRRSQKTFTAVPPATIGEGAPVPHVPRRLALVHEWLMPQDKLFRALQHQCAPLIPGRPLHILKVASDTGRRKQYLAYRSFVEQMLTMLGAGSTKYGNGGEGNEHRRYFPVTLQCDLGLRGTPGSRPQLCENAQCGVCSLLRDGFSLAASGTASHYFTSSVESALSWCSPNACGLAAFVVARVVVGQPTVQSVTDPITLPQDPSTTHSTVVSDGDAHHDGTYVFRDDAADAQFVVIYDSTTVCA